MGLAISNNNPGNLKFTSLTQSLRALKSDLNGFCIFANYGDGFEALCDFLRFAARDELISYHESRTLLLFTQTYANPPTGSKYAENVAKSLGVSVNEPIKNLL